MDKRLKKKRMILRKMDSRIRSIRARAGRGDVKAQTQLLMLLELGLVKRTKYKRQLQETCEAL